MNRWIAALAMGLATAANAPAAGPPTAAHEVISSARAAPHAISSADAAPRADAGRLHNAGLVFDASGRSRASLTGGADNALAASGPDPVVAWLLAAGFLGVIVTRRTRASRGY